jgi:hypothetical protein
MGEIRRAHRTSVGKPGGKSLFGKPMRRREDIRMNLKRNRAGRCRPDSFGSE